MLRNFFISAFMIAIGVFILPRALTDWRIARDSEHWAYTEGIVISSKSTHRSSGKTTQYVVTVDYRYRVGDMAYRGNNLRPGSDAMTFNDAESTIAKYPSGATVRVRYSQKDPTQALLIPGTSSGIYLNLGFSLLFLFLGCWLMIMTFRRANAPRMY